MAIDFPSEPDLHDHTFADVDGTATAMTEWMGNVGDVLNLVQAGDGIVFADTANGHTYRMVSTNGVLTLVQVT